MIAVIWEQKDLGPHSQSGRRPRSKYMSSKKSLPSPPPTERGVVVALSPRRAPGPPVRSQLEALFREHRGDLLRFLKIRLGCEADANDALQIVFTRLLQRADSLEDDNLVSLLYVSARNVAIDLIRERRHAAVDAAAPIDAIDVPDERPGPDRHAQGQQRLKLLMSLTNELPRRCRSAFISYKLEQMEYADIARRMGVTESMVRKYVIKAVAYCAARFERMEGWE
jgi:RNA polymerase sigma-70 factor (ECF subfamily)